MWGQAKPGNELQSNLVAANNAVRAIKTFLPWPTTSQKASHATGMQTCLAILAACTRHSHTGSARVVLLDTVSTSRCMSHLNTNFTLGTTHALQSSHTAFGAPDNSLALPKPQSQTPAAGFPPSAVSDQPSSEHACLDPRLNSCLACVPPSPQPASLSRNGLSNSLHSAAAFKPLRCNFQKHQACCKQPVPTLNLCLHSLCTQSCARCQPV